MRFAADPDLLHWRGILTCISEDTCVVVTPDRDVEETTLKVGDTYTQVKRMQGDRLPGGVRERDTYLPRHADGGNIGADEMRRLVQAAERGVQGREGRRRVTGKLGPDGRVHLEGTPKSKAADGRLLRDVDGEAEEKGRWLVVFSEEPGLLGAEVEPPGDASRQMVGGKRYVLHSQGGTAMLCQLVVEEDFDRRQKEVQAGNDKAAAEEKDVRILSVLFDTAEERWRTVAEAVPEFEEIDYDDFPLQGPRTISHDSRQLRRLGMDFVQHHESWMKKSGVRSSDRSVHEHSSICRVLNMMMCYDQLNLPALASAEALNRRRTLIEHAHQGRPEAPSYEGAEDFLGVRESSDGSIIDPALAQHAARRQAAKAEVMKQTRLAAEEKRLVKKGDGKGGKDGAAKEAATKP